MARRFLFVAAITRTAMLTSLIAPSRRKDCSSKTRKSLACKWMGTSPISSRKTVPPLARSGGGGASDGAIWVTLGKRPSTVDPAPQGPVPSTCTSSGLCGTLNFFVCGSRQRSMIET